MQNRKKSLIWISSLLEMDVYFQNIALAASAEALYRLQRRSGANICVRGSVQAWSFPQAEALTEPGSLPPERLPLAS